MWEGCKGIELGLYMLDQHGLESAKLLLGFCALA